MILRELLGDDRSAVDDMLKACGVFTAEEIRIALQLVDEWLPSELDEDYAFFVVELDGQVQGYVCISKTPLTTSTWHLYWICVHPEAQGTGAGRALMSYVETYIRSHGGERMVLETSGQPKYERTRRFYHRGGYNEVGRIKDFYKTGDDCVVFCKEFKT